MPRTFFAQREKNFAIFGWVCYDQPDQFNVYDVTVGTPSLTYRHFRRHSDEDTRFLDESPVHIFTASCHVHSCSSSSSFYPPVPVNKRSRTRPRREKVKEQKRAAQGDREVERRVQGRRRGIYKKEVARDLVPKCQFLLPQSAASRLLLSERSGLHKR